MYVLELTHVHPERDASKPTRNGFVHPMIHLIGLLLAFENISCEDISQKIEKARNYPDMSPEAKAEVIELYSIHLPEALGLVCEWDAKAD